MEHLIMKEPQFWINSYFRLNSPYFRFALVQGRHDSPSIRSNDNFCGKEGVSDEYTVCRLYDKALTIVLLALFMQTTRNLTT